MKKLALLVVAILLAAVAVAKLTAPATRTVASQQTISVQELHRQANMISLPVHEIPLP